MTFDTVLAQARAEGRTLLNEVEAKEALREAEEGRLIAEPAVQRTLLGYALAVRAVAQAHLGQDAAAGQSAERALELARQTSGVPAWIFATWAVGHLELVRGDPVAATATLRPLVDHHLREEIREPGALPFMPDAVEIVVPSKERTRLHVAPFPPHDE